MPEEAKAFSGLAPIALFVYSRPRHTRAAVEALAANTLAGRSELHIFSDAPGSDRHIAAVREVRDYINGVAGFAAVRITERERNFGLADSIVDGVTRLVNQYDRIVVVEDDLITSPHFLEYMNRALDLYRDEERVMHVAGHMLPINPDGLPESFFMRQSSCWGWGTWAGAWKHFRRDSAELLDSFSAEDISRYNLEGAMDYWAQIQANHAGTLRTWAAFWYASVFRRGGLCLHPRTSLVRNIGHDGSGENCGGNNRLLEQAPAAMPVNGFPSVPKDLFEHPEAMRRYQDFLRRGTGSNENRKTVMRQKRLRKICHDFSAFLRKASRRVKAMARALAAESDEKRERRVNANAIFENDCMLGEGAVLFPTAAIQNNLGRRDAIRIGKKTYIRGELLTFGHGGDIFLGDFCYVGENTRIWSAGSIHIGDRTLISHNVTILDNDTHPLDEPEARHRQFLEIISVGHPKNINLRERPVFIGHDVLISCHSVILPGVSIGEGAVVGAGAIVTGDIPPFCVAVGNPARVVRKMR